MKTALTLVLLAAALAARAEGFTVLIFEPPAKIAARGSAPAYWKAYNGYFASLQKAGVMRGGAALHGDDKAVTVGKPQKKGRLQLGGYFQIDVKDLAAAKAWARRCPAAKDGAVEIRPNYPNPAMKENRP